MMTLPNYIQNHLRLTQILSLMACLLILNSCAAWFHGVTGDHSADQQRLANGETAQQFLTRLAETNKAMQSFKGIGKLTLNRYGDIRTARIAWAGSSPDKLRIEVWGAPGQVLARMATDGQWVYFESRARDDFIKKPSSKGSLERFLALPIKLQDIHTLIAGRIPTCEYDHLDLKPIEEQKVIVSLNNNWLQCREKIYCQIENGECEQIEVFDRAGELKYRVQFADHKSIDGFSIPGHISLSDDAGVRIDIDIQSYQPNAMVDPSIFILHPPLPS
jgi:hypothetical protein